MTIKKVFRFFDVLEDKIRARLSTAPILYALVGGVGVVMFWRGIWHTADAFPFLTGPVSIIVGAVILLLSGIFVSSFVGSKLIISGLSGEKKLTEKTKEEIDQEESQIKAIQSGLLHIEKELSDIKSEIHHDNKKNS